MVLALDNTGLAFWGPGTSGRLKHGEKRRAWRKPHLAVDARTGEVLAHMLTQGDTSDAIMARPPRSLPKIVIPPGNPTIRTPSADHGGTARMISPPSG